MNVGADFRVSLKPTDGTKAYSVEFCIRYGLHTAVPEFFCSMLKSLRNRVVLYRVSISITEFSHVPRMNEKRKHTYII